MTKNLKIQLRIADVREHIWAHPDPARKLSTNLYDIYHCWVYNEKTPDAGQRLWQH